MGFVGPTDPKWSQLETLEREIKSLIEAKADLKEAEAMFTARQDAERLQLPERINIIGLLLYYASRHNKPDFLDKLLAAGADINAEYSNSLIDSTELFHAALQGTIVGNHTQLREILRKPNVKVDARVGWQKPFEQQEKEKREATKTSKKPTFYHYCTHQEYLQHREAEKRKLERPPSRPSTATSTSSAAAATRRLQQLEEATQTAPNSSSSAAVTRQLQQPPSQSVVVASSILPPLHQACKDLKVAEVKRLLDENKEFVDTLDDYGKPALHYVVSDNINPKARVAIINLFKAAGADFNFRYKDTDVSKNADIELTLLHTAAKYQAYESVTNTLVDAGAVVDNRSSDNQTPLFIACSKLTNPSILPLLKRGADPCALHDDGPSGKLMGKQSTPLYTLYEANSTAQRSLSANLLQMIDLTSAKSLNLIPPGQRFSLIATAVLYEKPLVRDRLLKKKRIDLRVKCNDKDAKSALDIAFMGWDTRVLGHWFSDEGTTRTQEELESALLVACYHQDALWVNKLINEGLDINPIDQHRYQPLNYAICSPQADPKFIDFLIKEKGAKVNLPLQADGVKPLESALHTACRTGKPEIVRVLLLKLDADAYARTNDDNEKTPLHALFDLEDSKPTSSIKDSKYDQELEQAREQKIEAQRQILNVFKMQFRDTLDLTVKDAQGRTVAEYAKEQYGGELPERLALLLGVPATLQASAQLG